MAKNLHSVSFTVLLVVLVMASTGILKSEAVDCPGGCSLASERVLSHECGPNPYLGNDTDCCTCCQSITNPPTPFCWAAAEGTIKHCHCYIKKVE